MKKLVVLSLTVQLCSCVTGKLVRVDDPSVDRQVVQNFTAGSTGESLRSFSCEIGYVESPFAQAVLKTQQGKFKYVDVRRDESKDLSMLEGQTVTLPWIP